MKQFCSNLLIAGVAVTGLLSPLSAYAQGRKIDFNRDIRPLLSNTCYKCHGPDEKERKAGLRLDTQEGAGQKLESGAVTIVRVKGGESERYSRRRCADPDEPQPPPD